jgi:SNF2 family DNA or RNA helicase
MLDLLETLLARYGIQNLRYDGKMRTETRDATLVAFRKTGGPRVILISIKCGGVGLNLTTANRVIKCVGDPTFLFLSLSLSRTF